MSRSSNAREQEPDQAITPDILQEEIAHHSEMPRTPLHELAAHADDGGSVASSLIELRREVEKLDPTRFDLDPGWTIVLAGGTTTVIMVTLGITYAIASIVSWSWERRASILSWWWRHRASILSWWWRRRARDTEPDTAALREELETFSRMGHPEPLDQLTRLKAKHEAVQSVLSRRMRSGELTARRYAEAATHAWSTGLDNLNEIVVAHTVTRGIDASHLKERLEPDTNLSHEERTALRRRRELLEKQQRRIDALLSKNEAIMTALDEVGTALADTRTDGSRSTDTQDTIAMLTQLAQRTNQYAASPFAQGQE